MWNLGNGGFDDWRLGPKPSHGVAKKRERLGDCRECAVDTRTYSVKDYEKCCVYLFLIEAERRIWFILRRQLSFDQRRFGVHVSSQWRIEANQSRFILAVAGSFSSSEFQAEPGSSRKANCYSYRPRQHELDLFLHQLVKDYTPT
jgi:hypothetical protein